MPSHKDVVLAILGAATGLAGLVLVFVGLLVSAFESYDREGKAVARPKFEPTAWTSVAAFLLGLLAIVFAVVWLLRPASNALFVAALVAFLFDVAIVAYIAVSVVVREFRTA